MEMRNVNIIEQFNRYALGILLALLALNAFGGGYYGMAGAKGVPKEWLIGSPFSNYFIPGLFLFLFVGGSAFIASIAVFSRSPKAGKIAYISAVIVLLWLLVQVMFIGFVSWLQPTTAVAALIILFLTSKLPN